ncbi:MAG: glutamate racemase [Candidatus Zixiibacteriota bacterium]|nr:MAG: glutamate racemase [candidate division Zixibacteria bacterium]
MVYPHDQDTNPAQRPIGIFDSGIGGLTVARQIMRRLPGESLVYFGDTARVPYGTKSDRTVREFAWEDSLFLLGHDVKTIVVACNTVSAVALDELDRHLKIPVIGVIEPGAQAAADRTRNGRLGVIGTQATVDSRAYERAVQRLNPRLSVFSTSCPLFVPLVEEGWVEGEVPQMVARQYLTPLLDAGIDTLILGCTHYPLLKPMLSQILDPDVQLVDSSEEIAIQVQALLEQRGERSDSTHGARHFFVSDYPRRFEELGKRFLGEPVGGITIAEPWKHFRPAPMKGQP